ncbi:MAG: hypothetical protein P4L92_23085 [Rudaea sp.]|nr:hypothetical protein [Rudaea sp.]
MAEQKTRTPEEQAAFDEGVAEARAEFAARKKAGETLTKPKHMEPNYTGPLTGDQAADIHRARKTDFREPETKPVNVKGSK